MEANLGNVPSFAWRSIFSAKDLLQEGLMCRIGDGKRVKIWRDKWIPLPTSYSIQSPRLALLEDASVSELIDQDSKRWNGQLIMSIFTKDEAEVILKIPLSRYGHDDLMVWRGTITGEFSVQSAYHMEKERIEASNGNCSYQSDLFIIWKRIWRLNVPNSLKKNLWKACHDTPYKG